MSLEIIGLFFILPIFLILIAGTWKAFAKAGKPGWGAIVPIYDTYLKLKIAGQPGWWLLLFIIPIVNFIIAMGVNIDIAKGFGKSTGFGLGLSFLPFIFWPLLGFGSAQYRGPPN